MVNPQHATNHVFVHLDQLSRRGQNDMRRLIARARMVPGMRGSIGRILSLIPDRGARPTELAEGAWITKQSFGERFREMEQLGLVTVRTDPTDGRALIVRRTRRGTRVLATAHASIAAMESEWSTQVGADRYATFRDVLAELAAGAPVIDVN